MDHLVGFIGTDGWMGEVQAPKRDSSHVAGSCLVNSEDPHLFVNCRPSECFHFHIQSVAFIPLIDLHSSPVASGRHSLTEEKVNACNKDKFTGKQTPRAFKCLHVAEERNSDEEQQ